MMKMKLHRAGVFNGIIACQLSTHNKLTYRAPIQMSMSNLLSYIMYNIYIYMKYVYDDGDED